jgi:formylglycine-generating enzyme required for sulfatase activity
MNRTLRLRAALIFGLTAVAGTAFAEPEAGAIWVEPATGMKFTWVPSGCFDMGDASENPDETPVHNVCVKGFYLGVQEVTQAQYEKVVGKNPSHFAGKNLPVDSVSWNHARDMAQTLTTRSGVQFRLPSEAEWEYACRAGGYHTFYCGEGKVTSFAWFSKNSDDQSAEVGGKAPNHWGLFDMSGNVWEWTMDCWHENYKDAPNDGSPWVEGGDCKNRVARGGSFGSASSSVRASTRNWYLSSGEFIDTGFRLLRVF